MGLLTTLQKEIYINRLIRSYRMQYGCGDRAAIECLRKYYSKKELEETFNYLKEAKGEWDYKTRLFLYTPFKEDFDEVAEIDFKYKGR